MFNNQWFKKEAPLLSLLGLSGGAGSNLTGGGGGISATGGTAYAPGNGYYYHKFVCPGSNPLSDSPFQVVGGDLAECRVLLVAGGGGGGSYYGSGGGAGGLAFTPSDVDITEGSYQITIGNGGADVPGPGADGNKGDNSAFGPPTDSNDVQCHGGGGGGWYGTSGGGQSGGSGGGKGSKPGGPWTGNAATQPTISNPPAYTNAGNAGGAYTTSSSGFAPGGGGGAGGAGVNGGQSPAGGGAGGSGYQIGWADYPLIGMSPYAYSPTGTNSQPQYYPNNDRYAGGGGAGCFSSCHPTRTGCAGAGGGGGQGAPANCPAPDFRGLDGLGGGGGGIHGPGQTSNGGGGGICVIRYPTDSAEDPT